MSCLVGLCTTCTNIVFEAQFQCLASSRHVVALGRRGTSVGETPRVDCSEPPPCSVAALGTGWLWQLPPRTCPRTSVRGEGTQGGGRESRGCWKAEIKNGKEKEEEREAKAKIQTLSGAGESVCYSAFTLPLLSSTR